MRRLLAPLLALALCAFVTPPVSAEDKGVLVVVSNGPGEGTLTLPHAIQWAPEWPTMTGKSPYALLSVSAGEDRSLAVVRFPEARYRQWAVEGHDVPAGRHTVRMLAVGPTTLRIPVTGFRGTRTVRLDRRLRQGFAEIRTIPLREVHDAEDVIPFTVPKHSVLAHGVIRHSLVAGYADSSCTTGRGDRCGWPVAQPRPEVDMGDREWLWLYVDFWQGEGDAVMKFTQVATAPEPVTHFLLVLPTA